MPSQPRPSRARRITAALCLAAAAASLESCANLPAAAGSVAPDGQGARVRHGAVDQSAKNDYSSGWAPPRPAEGTPVLYGRDGSPVGSSTPGQVVETERSLNSGVAPPGGSRIVLLEMFEQAVQERDELLLDFDDLVARFERAEQEIARLTSLVESLTGEVATLRSANTALSDSQFELAGRLAQAQISRLESERALLEATIEWRSMNAANNRAVGSPGESGR